MQGITGYTFNEGKVSDIYKVRKTNQDFNCFVGKESETMNVQKVKLHGGDYKRLSDHMERKHKYYKNDVDQSKSHNNITLKSYVDDLEEHIRGQGVKRIRKDAVGAYNAVCTVAQEDKDTLKTEDDYKVWGWTVIDATLKAFNLTRDDLVGATIHLDEGKKVKGGNAHVHFSFTPLIRSKEKVTLSAKRVGNKKAFKGLHDILQADMTARGFKGIYVNPDESLRGMSKDSLDEYKKAQEIIPKLEQELNNYKEDSRLLRDENKRLVKENKKLMDENKRIYLQVKELEKLKKEISKLSFFEKVASRKIKGYEWKLSEKDKIIKEQNDRIESLTRISRNSPSIQLQDLYKKTKEELDLASRRISILEKDKDFLKSQNIEYADRLGLSDIERSNQKQGLDKLLEEFERTN